MKKIVFLLLMCSTWNLFAEDQGQAALRISQGAWIAANAADVASSWGGQELNPILGQGTFGGRQLAIKTAITASLLISERRMVAKHPESRKALTVANWALSGVIVGLATSNWIRK